MGVPPHPAPHAREEPALRPVDFLSADLGLGVRGADVWVVPANPGGNHDFDADEWEFHRRRCRCGVEWWETVRPAWAVGERQTCCL